MMKNDRQSLIMAIIKEQAVGTQEDLGDLLERRGVTVTQATLSRDIKELGLIKVPTMEGYYRYSLPVERASGDLMRRAQRMLEDAILSVEAAGNIIVIKTTNGSAQAVAAALDEMDLPELLGTVAGDNTIFGVVREEQLVGQVLAKLQQIRR
jgi:transcriptional regulator of arginine metabolism